MYFFFNAAEPSAILDIMLGGFLNNDSFLHIEAKAL